jgi:predicted DNA-binding protein with PD1-like motif
MQAVGEGSRWMLRMDPGEELIEALGRFAETHQVRAAAVAMGIGTLRSATLGYWNGSEYEKKVVDRPTELVALGGSIAEADGRPSVHLHAALGTRNHETVSGHVHSATVNLLAEVLVETFPSHVFGRPLDESVGLRILDLEPGTRTT